LAKKLRNQNERASKFKPQTRERREKEELGDDGGRGGDNNASLRARSREGERGATSSDITYGAGKGNRTECAVVLIPVANRENRKRQPNKDN
jgi:hypothetical protein